MDALVGGEVSLAQEAATAVCEGALVGGVACDGRTGGGCGLELGHAGLAGRLGDGRGRGEGVWAGGRGGRAGASRDGGGSCGEGRRVWGACCDGGGGDVVVGRDVDVCSAAVVAGEAGDGVSAGPGVRGAPDGCRADAAGGEVVGQGVLMVRRVGRVGRMGRVGLVGRVYGVVGVVLSFATLLVLLGGEGGIRRRAHGLTLNNPVAVDGVVEDLGLVVVLLLLQRRLVVVVLQLGLLLWQVGELGQVMQLRLVKRLGRRGVEGGIPDRAFRAAADKHARGGPVVASADGHYGLCRGRGGGGGGGGDLDRRVEAVALGGARLGVRLSGSLGVGGDDAGGDDC